MHLEEASGERRTHTGEEEQSWAFFSLELLSIE